MKDSTGERGAHCKGLLAFVHQSSLLTANSSLLIDNRLEYAQHCVHMGLCVIKPAIMGAGVFVPPPRNARK
jgi:hypothetical protein